MNYPQGPYDDMIYKGLIAFLILLLAAIPLSFVVIRLYEWANGHATELFFAMCVVGFFINERKRIAKCFRSKD